MKKATASKGNRKACASNTAKKSVTMNKKRTVSNARKKNSTSVRKRILVQIPHAFIEETVVTVASTTPGNGFGTSSASPLGLLVDKVPHFYNLSNAAIIDLVAGRLKVGDTVHFKGHPTDFEPMIESMELDD